MGFGRAAPCTCRCQGNSNSNSNSDSDSDSDSRSRHSVGWRGGSGCGDAVNPACGPAQPLAVCSGACEAVLRKQSALTLGLGRGIHAAGRNRTHPAFDSFPLWLVVSTLVDTD